MCVAGERPASALGIVLPHEHLNVDSSFLVTDASGPRVPVEQIDLADLRARPMSFAANLDLRAEAIAQRELAAFASAGGGTLVDVTPTRADLACDPDLLLRLSRATGVNVIMGTGYYVEAAHPPALARLTVNEIASLMIEDIRDGIGPQRIRAGVIGELGTGDPLLPGEIRVLRAAAQAHLATGCPMNIHMAAGCREVFRVLEILRSEGVQDLSRTVISHMDVAIDVEQQRRVISLGAIVEYDTFGHERYPDSRGFMMPADEERIAGLVQLHASGLLDRVLVSQDVCFRHLWRHYGGHGYTNLLTRVRPMMERAGIHDDAIHQLFVATPARIFAYLP